MTVFGFDPVGDQVRAVLVDLDRGEPVAERRNVDLKEEAGRRDTRGQVLSGYERSDKVARALAGEVACMANTPGGGALIVGVADDGTLIGAESDEDWLQVRLYQLLEESFTTSIHPVYVDDTRLLVIRCPPAVQPIRWRGRITWRIGDRCHDVDPATWHERRARSWGYDWSAQTSGLKPAAARLGAITIARDFLRESGDERAEDLADASPSDLLRRLAVISDDGMLTNAGALLFVGRRTPALDHIRRAGAGMDSELRVNDGGRSVLEELAAVFAAIRSYNPETHVERGLVISRMRALPERAIREAIVNGIAHREWTDDAATMVEHIGKTLRVTSPGGFYGGVRTDNIINHPPVSRNRDLSAVLATLRVAERQGIGVDRMFADMIRFGHPVPAIEERDGVSVRAVLAGERPDLGWTAWLSEITPDPRRDLRVLMGLHRLTTQRWTDAEDLAPVLQVTEDEAQQAVEQIVDLTIGAAPVCQEVAGTPPSGPGPVVAVSARVLSRLDELRRDAGVSISPALSRESIAQSYARAHGRISTTELGSILHADPSNVGRVLRRLEEDGELEPSRPNRRGAGFYYRYVGVQ